MTTDKLELKFIALHPDAVLPQANGADAMALDLASAQDYWLDCDSDYAALISSGVVLSPESRQYTIGQQLSLRSGFSLKSGCILANGLGLIESSFTGFVNNEKLMGISAALINVSEDAYTIDKGDRIAQLLVYSADGRVLLPERDFGVAWDESYYEEGSTFVSLTEWRAKLGPDVGGRGGFGSTGS